MASKKRLPPMGDLIVVRFADGAILPVSETVAWLLVQHHKGAKVYRYAFVGEAAQCMSAAESKEKT